MLASRTQEEASAESLFAKQGFQEVERHQKAFSRMGVVLCSTNARMASRSFFVTPCERSQDQILLGLEVSVQRQSWRRRLRR